MGEIELRDFRLSDYDQVSRFWASVGLKPSRSDTVDRIRHKLERDPELFILAVDNGAIVGTVFGSYDGRRGWMNRLAVAPPFRGQGLARRLAEEVERRLRRIGCDKMNLLIEADNAAVQSLYEKMGYERVPLIFMEKWIA
jgi:ribosomal protein S18 acetylase RimI-like enzyme